MSTVSAAPLFFDGVDPRLDGLLKDATLMLAPLFDDGILARGEDRAIRGRGGEVLHLFQEAGVSPEKIFVLGVNLQRDGLP
jgi:hypothetical protein